MKLARFIVVPSATDVGITHQWQRIDVRSRRSRTLPLGKASLVALAFVLATAAGLLVAKHRVARSVRDGAVLGSDAGIVAVALADGLRVEALPKSRLAVTEGPARALRVEILRGGAWFEIARTSEQRYGFVVNAGALDIEIDVDVAIARFRVGTENSTGGVRVAVEQGAIAIRPHDPKANHLGALEGFPAMRLTSGEEKTFVSNPPAPPPSAPADGEVSAFEW